MSSKFCQSAQISGFKPFSCQSKVFSSEFKFRSSPSLSPSLRINLPLTHPLTPLTHVVLPLPYRRFSRLPFKATRLFLRLLLLPPLPPHRTRVCCWTRTNWTTMPSSTCVANCSTILLQPAPRPPISRHRPTITRRAPLHPTRARALLVMPTMPTVLPSPMRANADESDENFRLHRLLCTPPWWSKPS
jgi:hypothetical protein